MSTIPASGNEDFREQLSAWYDCALPDEASRFVLKRLLQDEALRAELGRWQAVGDVLRRQSSRGVGAGLPARIAAAIEAEAKVDAPAIASSRATAVAALLQASAPRLRWWATAAVVGMAAVLLIPGQDVPPGTELVAQGSVKAPIAAIAAAPPGEQPIDVPLNPIPRNVPLPPPPPLPPPLPLPLQPQRAGSEPGAMVASVPPLVRAPQPTAEQLAPLPAIEAPSRPWPRSVGPADAFTVDFVPPTGDNAPRP